MKTSFVFRNRIKDAESNYYAWEPAQVVWLLTKLNTPISEGGLGPNSEAPSSVFPELFQPGSVETPWTMSTIEEWRGAADQNITAEPNTGFYEVGEVLLERNPSDAAFANYVTAVKDPIRNPLAVARGLSSRGLALQFGEEADRSKKTIYEIKCDRLKADGRDSEIATIGRSLMTRQTKTTPGDLIELPNTLVAMFISEVTRLPLMLSLGLMLLDLIEAKVHYGQTEAKQYTWKKMMSYAKGGGQPGAIQDQRWQAPDDARKQHQTSE